MGTVIAGPDESAIICSAYNDYFLDVWPLKTEKRRLRLAMTVNAQDPRAAAAEIRRIGKRPEVCAVYLPLINILIGNRYYEPIYEAAVEHGLPILLHVTGTDSVHYGAPNQAGGFPENYPERYVSLAQIGEANLDLALLLRRVREVPEPEVPVRRVQLRLGAAADVAHRADLGELRYDVPWVKRSPREYVSERVRFSTQPLDEPANPEHLKQLIAMLGPEHLVFATDYPHWDNDMPGAEPADAGQGRAPQDPVARTRSACCGRNACGSIESARYGSQAIFIGNEVEHARQRQATFPLLRRAAPAHRHQGDFAGRAARGLHRAHRGGQPGGQRHRPPPASRGPARRPRPPRRRR